MIHVIIIKELSRPSPMSKRKRDDDLIVEGELITQILDSMGVQSYEGTVVPQLIEVMHRYSEEVLKDAYDYALHTGRKSTEMGDLKVALKIRDLNPAVPSRAAMTLNLRFGWYSSPHSKHIGQSDSLYSIMISPIF